MRESGSQATAVRLSYFFAFAAAAALIPFASLYYRSLDFSPQQIGVLLGIPLLTSVLATPAWGAAADATHRHRAILVIAVGGAAVGAALIPISDTYAVVAVFALLQAAMFAPVNALLDNGALTLLGAKSAHYGRFRVWGTIGWGVSAPLVGWVVADRGPRWIFPIYIVLMGGLLIAALRLPVADRPPSERFGTRIRTLTRSPSLWAFLTVAFLGGVGMSMINAYLPLYLAGMGATGLVGVALLIATISELPVMMAGPALLARLGLPQAFILALVLYGLRGLALSFAGSAWEVLALQLLHGPTFALMWVSGVALARRLAPAGVGAVAQGLFTSTSNGLGGALGAVLGGRLYAHGGAPTTFRGAGGGGGGGGGGAGGGRGGGGRGPGGGPGGARRGRGGGW